MTSYQYPNRYHIWYLNNNHRHRPQHHININRSNLHHNSSSCLLFTIQVPNARDFTNKTKTKNQYLRPHPHRSIKVWYDDVMTRHHDGWWRVIEAIERRKHREKVPLNISNPTPSTNRFVLKDQPNAFQRKSYKSERRYIYTVVDGPPTHPNRYLTPNPLIICTRESCGDKSGGKLPRILSGSVQVELVDGLGRRLDPEREIFEPADGMFEVPLNSKCTAEFSLKVLQNSGPDLFSLLFTVNYVTSKGERFTEQIQSRKFVVQSNKALKAKGE